MICSILIHWTTLVFLLLHVRATHFLNTPCKCFCGRTIFLVIFSWHGYICFQILMSVPVTHVSMEAYVLMVPMNIPVSVCLDGLEPIVDLVCISALYHNTILIPLWEISQQTQVLGVGVFFLFPLEQRFSNYGSRLKLGSRWL